MQQELPSQPLGAADASETRAVRVLHRARFECAHEQQEAAAECAVSSQRQALSVLRCLILRCAGRPDASEDDIRRMRALQREY